MDVATLFSFLAASMLLTITPGPDVVYVATRSIMQGKKAGIGRRSGFAPGWSSTQRRPRWGSRRF